jgi:hypothetical protein
MAKRPDFLKHLTWFPEIVSDYFEPSPTSPFLRLPRPSARLPTVRSAKPELRPEILAEFDTRLCPVPRRRQAEVRPEGCVQVRAKHSAAPQDRLPLGLAVAEG